MRYFALATDYDGTIATHGIVDEPTLVALERLRSSGRKLIMVTGRELDDLMRTFPPIDLFDYIVAENGALLYHPATKEEKTLGERPPEKFIQLLQERQVAPMSVGRVIVATWEPHENTVINTIRDLGLELQVIFNKGAVMILPSGINKATGLTAALKELGLSAHNTVGVGDAENDHAFFNLCECSVAVANALPVVKERADLVTRLDHGAGVIELIDRLTESDLAELEPQLRRHHILLGTRSDGSEVRLKPYGENVLVTGTSGGGKSTLAMGLLERLTEQGYQYCIIDPEGDYSTLDGAVVLGDAKRAPSITEILELVEQPEENIVVNLLGITRENRPMFFAGLLTHLLELRARTGRPHWLVIDEAHHLLPSLWDPASLTLPQELYGLMLLTVHPRLVSRAILSSVETVIAIGAEPEETLRGFSEAIGQPPPPLAPQQLAPGEALVWCRDNNAEPVRVRSVPPRTERHRHTRKYAPGELSEDHSFYFSGPEGKLHLRAQNLMLFLQMADGVDDETWLYHLRRGDYSQWFRQAIKDEGLAHAAVELERRPNLSAAESRALMREAIELRYPRPA